jgi:outer membrane protein TolC
MIRCLVPLALLPLAACVAATPAPKTALPPAGAFTATTGTAIDSVPDDWWRLYVDPALDRLVRAALAANADLRVAFANLEGARASSRESQAARLPQTGIESGLTVDRTRDQPTGR